PAAQDGPPPTRPPPVRSHRHLGRPAGRLPRRRPAVPRVLGLASRAVPRLAAFADGAAARRSAPPPSGGAAARRRPGGLALARRAAGGVLGGAGGGAARGADIADTGGDPGGDAASAARGAQRHGPDRPR